MIVPALAAEAVAACCCLGTSKLCHHWTVTRLQTLARPPTAGRGYLIVREAQDIALQRSRFFGPNLWLVGREGLRKGGEVCHVHSTSGLGIPDNGFLLLRALQNVIACD
jgi:hypothetical protein